VDRVLRAHQAGLLFVLAVGASARRKRPWRTQIARRQPKSPGRVPAQRRRAAAARGGTAPGTLGVGRRAAGPGPGADPGGSFLISSSAAAVSASKPLRCPSVSKRSLAYLWPYRCLLFGLRFLGGLGPARPDAESLAQQRLARGVASESGGFSPTPSCTQHHAPAVKTCSRVQPGGSRSLAGRAARTWRCTCASAVGGGIATAVAAGLRVAMGGLPSTAWALSGAIWGLMGATLALVLADGGCYPDSSHAVAPAPAAGCWSSRGRAVSARNRSVRALWGGLVGFLLTRSDR